MIFSKQLKLQVTILNTNSLQLYDIKYSYLKLIILFDDNHWFSLCYMH